MDDGLGKRLNDPKYKNWLKVSIALLYSKQALHDFTRDVIDCVHKDIKKRTSTNGCVGQCSTGKGKTPKCATCIQWVQEIKSYSKGLLNWKNSDPTKWHSHPWEIAKCFMNAQGGKATAALNTGPEVTDISGILNVIVNCKEFAKNHLKERNAAVRVIETRNKVMHSSAMQFTDIEMKGHIQTIIELLEDEKELNLSDVCKEHVKTIKCLRDEDFVIGKEAESDCIEDLLKCYKMPLECGEDVDNDVKNSLENISNFIRNNNDLKSKFETQLTQFTEHFQNITDSLDSRISICEISDGKLNGKIEYLKSKITQIERYVGRINVINHEKCSSKSALQCYTQKKKLGSPRYDIDKNDSGEFLCTISVGDDVFKSNHARPTKKEAEQCAAEVALSYFSNETQENSVNNASTGVGLNQPLTAGKPSENTKDKNMRFKNLLQEYAQKEKHILPIYDTKQREDGSFTSNVFCNGQWFSPSNVSQSKKIDAEQAAAEFALSCIQERSHGEKSVVCESRGGKTSGNMIESTSPTTSAEVIADRIGMVTKENTSQNTTKTYKSILNEYCQKSNIPAAKYDTVSTADGMFISSVKVNDSVYESEIPKSNKRKSEEFAAMLACRKLDLISEEKLVGQLPDATNSKVNTTETTIITENKHPEPGGSIQCETTNDVIDGDVPLLPTSANCLSKKSYKSILQEHCQKLGESIPEYTSDEIGKGTFISSVRAIGTVYKSEVEKSSKKLSREHAAMIACTFSNLPSERNPGISQTDGRTIDEGNTENKKVSVSDRKEALQGTASDGCLGFSKHPISAAKNTQVSCLFFPSDVDTETDGGAQTANTLKDEDHCAEECSRNQENNAWSSDNGHIARENYASDISETGSLQQQLINIKNVVCLDEIVGENNFSSKTKDPISLAYAVPDHSKKTFKSIINEYCQRTGLTAAYETSKSVDDNLFVSCLTVAENVYNSVASTSKRQSEENAAMIACSQLNIIGSEQSAAVNPQVESTVIKSEEKLASLPCNNTRPTTTLEKTTTNIPECDYVGLLTQFTQRNKLPPPVFVNKCVEGSSDFFNRVFIGKRCFRGGTANKIKLAKRNAAKAAVDELTNGRGCESPIHCEKLLKEYHRGLGEELSGLPKYEILASCDERYSAQVTVAKKWEKTLKETRLTKKEVEKSLAEMALREIDEYRKDVPVGGEKSVTSRLHEFCQLQKHVPKPRYNVIERDVGFSGELSFFTVEEYESLSPQPSENEARSSAAMSACNGLGLATM